MEVYWSFSLFYDVMLSQCQTADKWVWYYEIWNPLYSIWLGRCHFVALFSCIPDGIERFPHRNPDTSRHTRLRVLCGPYSSHVPCLCHNFLSWHVSVVDLENNDYKLIKFMPVIRKAIENNGLSSEFLSNFIFKLNFKFFYKFFSFFLQHNFNFCHTYVNITLLFSSYPLEGKWHNERRSENWWLYHHNGTPDRAFQYRMKLMPFTDIGKF